MCVFHSFLRKFFGGILASIYIRCIFSPYMLALEICDVEFFNNTCQILSRWVQVNAITLFEMICYCKMIKWIVKIYILVTNLMYILLKNNRYLYHIYSISKKRQIIIPLFNFSAWPDVLQDTRHPKISIQCVIDNTCILSLLICVWTHSLKFKNLHIMAFRQLYLSINLYNTKFSHF